MSQETKRKENKTTSEEAIILFRTLHSVRIQKRKGNGRLTKDEKEELAITSRRIQDEILATFSISEGELHSMILSMDRGEGQVDHFIKKNLSIEA